jgi:hypothetical protein
MKTLFCLFLVVISAFGQTKTDLGTQTRGPVGPVVALVAIDSTGKVVFLKTDGSFTIDLASATIKANATAMAPPTPMLVDESFTVTSPTQVFTPSTTTPITNVMVYRNGVKQKAGVDYNFSGNGITFTMAAGLNSTDSVSMVYCK